MHKKQNKHDQTVAQPQQWNPPGVEDNCEIVDVDCPEFTLQTDYAIPTTEDMNAVRAIRLSTLTSSKWGQLIRDGLEYIDILNFWSDAQLDVVGGSMGQFIALPTTGLELLATAAATAVFGPFENLYAADEEADSDSLDGEEEEVQEDVVPHPEHKGKKSKK